MKKYNCPICITGPTNSGKTTAAEYIAEKYSFGIIEHSALARSVIKTRGMESTWDNIYDINIEIRERYGKGAIVETLLKAHDNRKIYIFCGIRTMDELRLLEKEYGTVSIGIILSKELEEAIQLGYQRMIQRKRAHESYCLEEFRHGFMREWHDEHYLGFNSEACILHVDEKLIVNDSTKADLYRKVDSILTSISFPTLTRSY